MTVTFQRKIDDTKSFVFIGDNNKKTVFLVFHETGSYDDYMYDLSEIFSTEEKAIEYINNLGYTEFNHVIKGWTTLCGRYSWDDEPDKYYIEEWEIK